ncbi:MAG: hypothetical protein NT002_09925 [candidate division Zixibacteria bacterium]|nr:hypothetical protein [candidate division Zixibacteria bacterium]
MRNIFRIIFGSRKGRVCPDNEIDPVPVVSHGIIPSCIVNNEPIPKSIEHRCPHCNAPLPEIPQRKKKCPLCGNYIFVRTDPKTRQKVLLTEEGVKQNQIEWEKTTARREWLRQLLIFGIDENYLEMTMQTLANKMGKQPAENDIINEFIHITESRFTDPSKLLIIYYSTARYMNEVGVDCFEMQQRGTRMELLNYKRNGVMRVEIISSNDCCDACGKWCGKKINVNRALELMPIPCKDCTNAVHADKPPFCRCCYAPVI